MKIPGEFMQREISEIPHVFGQLTARDMSDVSQLLSDEKRPIHSIVIAARGTSDNAAHFLKYLIETRLGIPCGLASPSAVTLYHAAMKYDSTLVIAVSQSGRSTDLVSYVESARKSGALVLSMTNDESSPIAKLSLHHIYLKAGEEIAVPATKSYFAQILASYLLVSTWVTSQVDTNSLGTWVENLLKKDVECMDFASALDISRPIYILGRGISYPNAREFGLKIQETCHVPVQSYSTSDFLHGPIAAMSAEAQVIFFAPANLPTNSFGDSLARIRDTGARIFWIGQPTLTEPGDVTLEGALIDNEIAASICDAVLFQKVTCLLSLRNGFDPDAPRGLKKITLTI